VCVCDPVCCFSSCGVVGSLLTAVVLQEALQSAGTPAHTPASRQHCISHPSLLLSHGKHTLATTLGRCVRSQTRAIALSAFGVSLLLQPSSMLAVTL
jgi:hypothetical protein